MYYGEDDIKTIVKKISIKYYLEKKYLMNFTKISGSKWATSCPFHKSLPNSFIVDTSRNEFFCMECQRGGNVLTFIKEYHDVSLLEAISILTNEDQSANIKKDYIDEQKKILEINKISEDIFIKNLSNKQAQAYIKKRGFTQDTIKKFRIGYAETGTTILNELKQRKYPYNIINESGVVKDNHDKFGGRLMFPIIDLNQEIIGFGGRSIIDIKKKPKYLNSPNTKVFDKSLTLFGLNFAKDSNEDCFIICEGYVDVVTMHQAGFTNSVASLGTAFTKWHAKLLKQFKDKVILCYDSDEPGQMAAEKAAKIVRNNGLEAFFLNLEPCKDPDEFIKTFGKEAFHKRINEAINFDTWIFKRAYKKWDPKILRNY